MGKHGDADLPPDERIGPDDYYRKNGEFSAWLKRKKDLYFDALKTDEARHLFDKFVRRWNSGQLSESYYSGKYAAEAQGATSRTGYKWGFAEKLTGDDRKRLETIRATAKGDTQAGGDRGAPERYPAYGAAAKRPKQGPAAPDREALAEYGAALRKADRQKYRQDHKAVMEELVPRETGREARIANKIGAREARAAREGSPEMREKDLMGSNDDSFHSFVQQRRAQQERKTDRRKEAAQDRIAGHQQKEAAKMAALLAMAKSAKSENALWKG